MTSAEPSAAADSLLKFDIPEVSWMVHGSKSKWISPETLGNPTSSNWPAKKWRTAAEQGHLPLYRFPNGRVAFKTEDVVAFVEGFAEPEVVNADRIAKRGRTDV